MQSDIAAKQAKPERDLLIDSFTVRIAVHIRNCKNNAISPIALFRIICYNKVYSQQPYIKKGDLLCN